MLVQRPPSFPSSVTHNVHHRRNPSAPVVVQPTRTPGLLSLSLAKPTQPRQPQQQQRPNRSPRSKPAAPHNRSPKPAPAEAQLSEKTQPTPAPTPDKHVRVPSNAPKAGKDKMNRRVAIAEDHTFANNKAKHNSFDPFVVSSSDSESDRPAPAQETLPKMAKPSGKLARRRQVPNAAPATPTPASTQAIPVPRPSTQPNRGRHGRAHSAMMNLSRSAPIAASPIAYGAFPICDDMTDADGLTPPATPVKARQALQFDNGPRTAPLASSHGFPFAPLPSLLSSPTLQRQRQHVRSPSEGVFNMSFDEDPSFSSSSDSASEELKMLFGLLPKRAGQTGSLRGMARPANSPNVAAAKAAKEALYASSMFQNSPSPDELPPPAF
ncbi:hypothetical protein HWV62_35358 [Athelia sp. TMB]|nr:hypothetical protein HWV62_35358 [Athelia sp. TMB]